MNHFDGKSTLGLPADQNSAPSATMYLPRLEFRKILGLLARRLWVLLLVLLSFLGAMWFVIQRIPPVFESIGSVYVSTGAPGIPEIREIVPVESKELEQLHSVANGLESSTLLLRVIEKVGLADELSSAAGVEGEQGWVNQFKKRVHVELRRGTRIIDIRIEDCDPERARLMVELLKQGYEELAAERHNHLMKLVGDGLAAEESRLRTRMEESARRLREFREAHPVPGIESTQGHEIQGSMLVGLRGQLAQVRAERLRLESEAETLSGLDFTKPDTAAQLPSREETAEVIALGRALREKQVEFASIKERYQYKHPVYREVASEIGRIEKNLATAVMSARQALEKNLQVAVQNESKLAAEVTKAESHSVDVDSLRAKFLEYERAANADRELYATVERRLRETSLAGSVPSSALRWEEMPLSPVRPTKPRKMVMMSLAGTGGLFMGLLAVFVLEITDRRLRDHTALERKFRLPVLASIPMSKNASGQGMVLIDHPATPVAESFRRLRAVLANESEGVCPRTILFTSAKRGEGKSFCALNYAGSLALQGYRTLLIDADLRQRGLSRDPSSTYDKMPGLGDYLDGTVQPAETCLLTSLPNLYLMASGKPREDAAELLADNRFPALLDRAFLWFDRVVIDVSSVLVASDVQTIARYADRACLVVSGRISGQDEIERALGMLRSAGAPLAGFIWNELPKSPGEQPYVSPMRRQIAAVHSSPDLGLPSVLDSDIHQPRTANTFHDA